MASVIRYLVLEVDNREITDFDRFVTQIVPRTPHLNLTSDSLYNYYGHILPIQAQVDIGARLYLAEVVVSELSVHQDHPYLVVYRETVQTQVEEVPFLMRRIERILGRLQRVSRLDFNRLQTTPYWNVMYVQDWMDEFVLEFAECFDLSLPK